MRNGTWEAMVRLSIVINGVVVAGGFLSRKYLTMQNVIACSNIQGHIDCGKHYGDLNRHLSMIIQVTIFYRMIS